MFMSETPNETITWTWKRQSDGSYLSDTGWKVEKYHYSGEAQSGWNARTNSHAYDAYKITRPDGTQPLDRTSLLKDAKLQAERRAYFDQKNKEEA